MILLMKSLPAFVQEGHFQIGSEIIHKFFTNLLPAPDTWIRATGQRLTMKKSLPIVGAAIVAFALLRSASAPAAETRDAKCQVRWRNKPSPPIALNLRCRGDLVQTKTP
jgi:hypothetical protein